MYAVRLPRPLRIFMVFGAVGLVVYAIGLLDRLHPAWAGLALVLSMVGSIGLLGWHGSRIRKRDMRDTSTPWVPVRAVIKSVQTRGEPTAGGKVPVRLWVQVDSYNATGQRTRAPVDTEVSPEAFGRFGESTVVGLLRHPTNKLLLKLDGEVPLDRARG